MGAPQVVLICISAVSLLGAAHLHGEDRGKWNFWTELVSATILIGILLWGGFFK